VFVDNDMVDHILTWTNRHADEIVASAPSFRWNQLDRQEFYAFLGLSLLVGIQQSKSQHLAELWDDQWGYPIFATTMSLQRFTNRMRVLRFDDKSTRTERVSTSGNQAAAVQDVFNLFLAKCPSSYCCGPSVTIDEQLFCTSVNSFSESPT